MTLRAAIARVRDRLPLDSLPIAGPGLVCSVGEAVSVRRLDADAVAAADPFLLAAAGPGAPSRVLLAAAFGGTLAGTRHRRSLVLGPPGGLAPGRFGRPF